METVWFCLVALMIGMYVVLDGFDLGAGVVHLFVARGEAERRLVIRTIGPVWDGNEVWLLAAGGTLYFAFPTLFATAFSGFYLPLMMVVWLLILRALGVELRNHVDSPAWKPFWDVVFGGASLVLIVFFGAALGNVVRGVPIDASGRFFCPLFTSLRPVGETGILDWYTVLVGLAALFTLTLHGALWVAMKTEGDLQDRSRRFGWRVWWGVLVMTGVVTWATYHLQPQVTNRIFDAPWVFLFHIVALAGLFSTKWFLFKRQDTRAFLASSLYILGMLLSCVFGLYPLVLPSTIDPAHALTVFNSHGPAYGLKVGLAWWIPGMILVTAYFVYTYRMFAGKVRLEG